MAESPVKVNNPGTMAQAAVAATIPEGMLIAPVWKRIVGFMLDVFLLVVILGFATQGSFFKWLAAFDLIFTDQAIYVAMTWIMHLTFFWLYFKYTGTWMGRSLGQRWFGIALVHDDATPLGEKHWGKRSTRKLIYAIPVVGLVVFAFLDYVRIRGDDKHQSRIDAAENTVAAVYWSLPWETRVTMR